MNGSLALEADHTGAKRVQAVYKPQDEPPLQRPPLAVRTGPARKPNRAGIATLPVPSDTSTLQREAMADGPDERVSSDVSPIESVLSEVSPNEQVPSDASPVEPVPSDDGEASTDADELWVRQWDAQAAAFFYLNPRTQEATWERPAGYVDTMAPEDDEGRGLLQEQAVDCSAPEVGDSQAEMAGAAVKIQSVYRGHGARKQQRQRQWIEQFDPSTGQMYYHNVSTGESKWERPRDFVAGVRDAKSEGIVKIQSAFRGKQTRDQIKQQSVSAHSTDEGASTQVGCDERDLAAASADNFRLEAAATIIQCAVRKRKASKRMEIRKERLRTLTDVGVMDQKARDLRQAIDELQAEVCARSMSGPEEAALFPHLVGLLSSWNPAIATMKDHYLALSGQIALISAAETVAARIEYAEQCHEAIGSVRDQCIALLRGVLLMNSYFVELDVHRINVACTAFANLKKNDLCALSDPRMRKIVQIEDLYASFALAEGSLRQAMGLTDFTICATTATGKKFEEFHPQVVAALDHMRELELRVAHKVELLHLYRKRQQVRDETTLMEHEDALATQVERVQRQRLTDQEERIKFLHRCRESWQKGIVQRRNDMRCQQNQEESRRHEDMQHRVRMEKMKMQELEQRKKVKLSIWEAVKEGMPVETIQSMLFAEVQKARRHGYEFSVMTARSERGETLLQIACWWGHEVSLLAIY